MNAVASLFSCCCADDNSSKVGDVGTFAKDARTPMTPEKPRKNADDEHPSGQAKDSKTYIPPVPQNHVSYTSATAVAGVTLSQWPARPTGAVGTGCTSVYVSQNVTAPIVVISPPQAPHNAQNISATNVEIAMPKTPASPVRPAVAGAGITATPAKTPKPSTDTSVATPKPGLKSPIYSSDDEISDFDDEDGGAEKRKVTSPTTTARGKAKKITVKSPTSPESEKSPEYSIFLEKVRGKVSGLKGTVMERRGKDLYTDWTLEDIAKPNVDHIMECQVFARAASDHPATRMDAAANWYIQPMKSVVNSFDNLNVTSQGINVSKKAYVEGFLNRMGTAQEMSLLYFFREWQKGREKKVYKYAAQICHVIGDISPSLIDHTRSLRREDGHVGKQSSFEHTADTLEEIVSIMDIDIEREGSIASRVRNRTKPRIVYKRK